MRNKTNVMNFLKIILCTCLCVTTSITIARDLDEVKELGILRHLGTPYGNFVKNIDPDKQSDWTGLDVELIQGFAASLGVKYQFVEVPPKKIIGALTGINVEFIEHKIVYGQPSNIQGDLIASGITTLEWRKDIFDFSDPYFYSAVWLFARADSAMQPITPSGSTKKDIINVKAQLKGHSVLTVEQTCLDGGLYDLQATNAHVIASDKYHNLIPAILDNNAESTLMDVADGLAILDKWAGEIKVIGPISEVQSMGVVFSKKSPKLRAAFNKYLRRIRDNGIYAQLVKKYYPNVFYFYPEYFSNFSPKITSN
ncbi:MAG: transporter substrate-binding domain-containing protein [Psychromonas sp.]